MDGRVCCIKNVINQETGAFAMFRASTCEKSVYGLTVIFEKGTLVIVAGDCLWQLGVAMENVPERFFL